MRDNSGFSEPGYGGGPDGPDSTSGGAGYGGPDGPDSTSGGAGDHGQGQPRRPRLLTRVLTHATVAVLAAALGAGVTLAVHQPASSSVNQPPVLGSSAPSSSAPGSSAVPAPAATPSGGGTLASGGEQAIVNKVEQGLVTINTTLQYNSEAAAGTGMVINSDGLVLTNNHVIEDSTKITATVVATGRKYTAKVIGYDKTGDIALIQLEGASGLHTIPVGNSAGVTTGAQVVGLGNAEGQGTIIPAAGRVTALNKTITASDQGGSVSSETLHGMIQTSANIVPGDSGGPLVSAAGTVIGMDTAASSVSFSQQSSPMGFAIPIDRALSVARQIAAGHASSTITIGYPPFVGIFTASGSGSSPQAQVRQQEQGSGFANGFGGFGGFNGFTTPGSSPGCYTSDTGLTVPSAIAPVSSGTLVEGTICGSPAASAGITAGSVITAVNGQGVGSPDSLVHALSRFRPGETISVTWTSPSGQHVTRSLHVAAGPPQ